MSTQTVFALLCFGAAALLGVTGAFLKEARTALGCLAVAAIGLGLAVQAS